MAWHGVFVLLVHAMVTSSSVSPPRCFFNLTAGDYFKDLTSPGYPSHYVANVNCTWQIHSQDPNKHVILQFTRSILGDLKCAQNDNITVYDGIGLRRRLLMWCGQNLPRRMESSGNSMTVVFQTKHHKDRGGFSVRYYQTPKKSFDLFATTPRPKCGGVYFVPSDYTHLTTTLEPGSIRGINCKWTLLSLASKRVQIAFTESHLKESRHCVFENVTVYDGGSTYSPILGRWCGSQTPVLTSSGRDLVVVFNSSRNSSLNFAFNMRQISDDDILAECTKSTTQQLRIYKEGYLQLPYFQFPNLMFQLECFSWRLTTDPSSVIEINIKSYIHPSQPLSCSNNYILIFSGHRLRKSFLGKWCGGEPTTYRSLGNDMIIEYIAATNMYYGLKISYNKPSQYQNVSSDAHPSVTLGAAVGGSFGALGLVVFVAVLGILCWRRKKPAPDQIPPTTSSEACSVACITITPAPEHIEHLTPGERDKAQEAEALPSYAEALSDNFQGIIFEPPSYLRHVLDTSATWNEMSFLHDAASATRFHTHDAACEKIGRSTMV